MIGPHYLFLTLLFPILTFFVSSRLVGHVSTKHVVLFAPETGIQGELIPARRVSRWPVEHVTLPVSSLGACEVMGRKLESFLRFGSHIIDI
ncbi:hypothetical protein PVK06_010733 [Gossypium arboreum]|uniref:Secreted protein n=1 Tax=Gossypium arboreum TaxID=29729 RepID=A0ABR0Q796_GOSAR|nr:hypothetical protein PVK06_010733 [Gossypium arboreum]